MSELALYAVLTVATVLGLISTTRIFGTFFEYVIRWMSPLVAMWIAASLWSCWLTWRPVVRHPRRPTSLCTGRRRSWPSWHARWWQSVWLGACRPSIPYERDSTITGALSAQLEKSLDPTLHYEINEYDPVALGSVAFGLALELERHHLHAGVGPWGTAGVMPFRVIDDEHAESTLWYVASKPTIAAFTALPGAVVRASFDVRTAAEAQRSDQLEVELLQALCAAGRQDLPRPALLPLGRHRTGLQPGTPSAMWLRCCSSTPTSANPRRSSNCPVGINGYDVVVPECAG